MAKEVLEKETPEIPQLIKDTALWEDGAIRQEKYRNTFIDDLDLKFEDADTLRRGIDYTVMMEKVRKQEVQLPAAEDKINYMAREILAMWEKHDKKARKEAKDTNTGGLDYGNNEEQIRWAKIHAIALLEVLDVADAVPDEEKKDAFNDEESARRFYGGIIRRRAEQLKHLSEKR